VSAQLVSVLDGILGFYSLLILVYVLMTWIPLRGVLWEIHQVIGSVVEPYLGLFRRIIPPLGSIDISPIVAILVVGLVRSFIRGLLG